MPGLASYLAIVIYLAGGPVLILLNNALLQTMGFPYPIALSAAGVVFSAAATKFLVGIGYTKVQPTPPGFFLRSVMPIATMSAATLAFGNASYVYLSVASCQIYKTLTPALTLGVLYALRLEKPSAPQAACVLCICAGTLVASRGDLGLSNLGVSLREA